MSHAHTVSLYLKLHYELVTLAIPHTKLLRPHSSSIMGNRYVTRAAHSRAILVLFLGNGRIESSRVTCATQSDLISRNVPGMVV